MHTLNFPQVNAICGGSYSEACYEAYKKVANDNYDFSFHLMMSEHFGPSGSVTYTHGLQDAVKSVCGDSFEETEAVYCRNSPSNCLNYKYKK